MVERIGLHFQIEELNTGVYVHENTYSPDMEDFDPAFQTHKHEIDYRIWIIQIAVWGCIVAVVKVILFILQLLFAPGLELTSNVLLGWLNMYPNAKLLLIMMFIPLLFNALQFWIQDTILKAKKETNMKFMSMSVVDKHNKTFQLDKQSDFDSVKSTKKSSSFTTSKSSAFRVQ